MPSFTWFDFLIVAAVLMVSYSVLRILHTVLSRWGGNRSWVRMLKQIIYSIKKIYEIIAVLILGAVFVFINPPLHGLMLLIACVFGFSHVRNYVSGRLALLENELTIGKRLKIGDSRGVIVKRGIMGLQLRTASGLRFVGYTQLFQQGYDLVSAEEVGGFYVFEMKPKVKTKNSNHLEWLTDALFAAPYIDPKRLPELAYTDETEQQIEAKILLRENNNLNELVQLVKEWGYDCTTKIDD
jgi:hypothetical protein